MFACMLPAWLSSPSPTAFFMQIPHSILLKNIEHGQTKEFQEQGRSLHPRAFFGIVSLRVRLIWSLLISGWLWNLKDFTKYRNHSENIKKRKKMVPPVIKKNYPVKSWFINPTSSRLRRWRWYFGLGLRLPLGLLITVWRHGWEYVYRLSIICSVFL